MTSQAYSEFAIFMMAIYATIAATAATGILIMLALAAYDKIEAAILALPALRYEPLPALQPFAPKPQHPALAYEDLYLAARAARNTLTLEQFFALAFDKAPTATPESFAALTSKQVATLRGKIHKEYNKNQQCKARAYVAYRQW